MALVALQPPAGGWSSDTKFRAGHFGAFVNGQVMVPAGSYLTTLPPNVTDFLLGNGFAGPDGDVQPIAYGAESLVGGWFNRSLTSPGATFIVFALLATGHTKSQVLSLINAAEGMQLDGQPAAFSNDATVRARGDELRAMVNNWNVAVFIPEAPKPAPDPVWVDGTTGRYHFDGQPPTGWSANPPGIPSSLLTPEVNAYYDRTYYPSNYFLLAAGGGLGGNIPPAPTQSALPAPTSVGDPTANSGDLVGLLPNFNPTERPPTVRNWTDIAIDPKSEKPVTTQGGPVAGVTLPPITVVASRPEVPWLLIGIAVVVLWAISD